MTLQEVIAEMDELAITGPVPLRMERWLAALKAEAERREGSCEGYDMIIFDPLYLMVTGDENSNSDMRHVAQFFVNLAAKTKALCVACHHFAKGQAGGKATIDRTSGAGVFARFPDALLMASPLESDDEENPPFRLEFVLRHHRPRQPVNFRFRHPLFIVDDSLQDLKVIGSPGRPGVLSSQDILKVINKIPKEKLSKSELARRLKVDRNTLRKYLERYEIVLNEQVENDG